MIHIYALIDPRNDLVFYIGQTIKLPEGRMSQHISESTKPNKKTGKFKNSDKCKLIREILNSGREIELRIIDTAYSKEEANELEIYWIAYCRKQGYPLTNKTIGGYTTTGYKFTSEARENLSKAQLKRYEDPEEREKTRIAVTGKNNGFFGKKHTNETRKLIRDARKNREPDSEETRKRKSNSQLKRYEDPEEHEKQRNGTKKRYEDPEERNKTREQTIRRYEDPEERKKTGDASRKAWNDAERIANASIQFKEYWNNPEIRERMLEGRNDRTSKQWENEEYRNMMTERMQGENHPMFGKNHSEETKTKMSVSQKARREREHTEKENNNYNE